jgi:hypothetical protein
MEFADLKSGDEITVRLGGHTSRTAVTGNIEGNFWLQTASMR